MHDMPTTIVPPDDRPESVDPHQLTFDDLFRSIDDTLRPGWGAD